MSDSPEKIFLQPPCCVDPEFGQVWCDHVPTDCPDDAPWTAYVRADLVQAQLAQAREQSDEFRNAYQRLFDRRAMRVVDLKLKVWEALNRRACPDGFMHIATEAIMEYGCGEIADLKKALETKDAELQQAREQVASKDDEIAGLVDTNEILDRQRHKNKHEITQIKRELKDAEGCIQRREQFINAQEAELTQLRDRLAGAMEWVTIAEADLQDGEVVSVRLDDALILQRARYVSADYVSCGGYFSVYGVCVAKLDAVTHILRITPPPSNPAERDV